MKRTVAQKMGIKEGARSYFASAPDVALNDIDLPYLEIGKQLRGEFDYIHLFVKTEEELGPKFEKLKKHLTAGGMFWVSWQKGKPAGADLTIKSVIKIGYDSGLVESTCLSINATWSGLKFTHPKKGKTYNNSYGKLPDHKQSHSKE